MLYFIEMAIKIYYVNKYPTGMPLYRMVSYTRTFTVFRTARHSFFFLANPYLEGSGLRDLGIKLI